ncbi:metallophosphoesterase [Cellvibrio sp. UBA7661]|uniref:metallophosphoesterase n=1 Tax=Cellvibrio sp. UBA7661 TaxID=1946311 RepID=UPI002F35B1B1
MKKIFFLVAFTLFIFITGCAPEPPQQIQSTNNQNTAALQIAFMPDIHFHDIYADFSGDHFSGLPTTTPYGTQHASIRSMRAQLHSTRLFNENYFSLLAALDDIAQRNIKYVALPGDFSDDGQPAHLRGLKTILDQYHRQYGIEFFAAPGNHDPTRPFSHPAGKEDYLGTDGKEQPIFSRQHPLCTQQMSIQEMSMQEIPMQKKHRHEAQRHHVVCSDEVQELGYQSIMDLLGDHGFYPKASYRYFETPYSTKKNHYDLATATREATFENRHYEICHQGTGGVYKQAHYSDCYHLPDSSYLVEPVDGLWLLAIDANVYQPEMGGTGNAQDPDNFMGSSDAGYNKVITHKTHLLEWITDVVARAQAQGKTLIAFSHFPMQEFYDGAGGDIAQLMGEQKFQLNRNPSTNTSKALADTGLKIHVAGHMHINDTGVYRGENGNVLFNIQAPSLAAYIPAYKILIIKQNQHVEVETVALKEVPRFDELFAHYRAEWNYLQSINAPDIWDNNILQATHYRQFTEWHLRELARLRFLPQEWPADIRALLMQLNGMQLLILSQLKTDISLAQLTAVINNQDSYEAVKRDWQQATKQAEIVAQKNGLMLASFADWTGSDLSVDFYRLWSADQLALQDISAQRFAHYQILAQQLLLSQNNQSTANNPVDNPLPFYQQRLGKLLTILVKFSGDAPSDHFLLKLDTGEITPLSSAAVPSTVITSTAIPSPPSQDAEQAMQ